MALALVIFRLGFASKTYVRIRRDEGRLLVNDQSIAAVGLCLGGKTGEFSAWRAAISTEAEHPQRRANPAFVRR